AAAPLRLRAAAARRPDRSGREALSLARPRRRRHRRDPGRGRRGAGGAAGRGGTAAPAADLANAPRTRPPAAPHPRICDRLYHEAAFAYDWVAALISGRRWRSWGERAARRLGGRVVEVGPGPGHVLAALRRRGVRAVGVELSAAMAGRAAGRSP